MNVQAIVVPTKYPNYVAVGGNIIKSDLAPVRTEPEERGPGGGRRMKNFNFECSLLKSAQ